MALRKVIIIGSGPAGYTAAIYTARANLNPLMLSGTAPGGQLLLTTMVENFPGFSEGIMGPDLMETLRKQAEKFGAEVLQRDAGKVAFKNHPFTAYTEDSSYQAETIIIATGANARLLNVPGESKFLGYGVSTCATCDGAFYRGKEVAVLGGGDSAMEEAVFLTHFATKVTVIHRRDILRASKIMQERARSNSKIHWLLNTIVEEVYGDSKAKGLKLRHSQNGKTSELGVDGIFIAIGHDPNTGIFRGQIDLDNQNYIIADKNVFTNIPGVFACGDAVDHRYRQAITAAGYGCMAALEAERYLQSLTA